MTPLRTRPLEKGDEPAFNTAYNAFVHPAKRPRPLEQMQRIWHEGPAGPVRSWIIEALEDDGWCIVGHHGLCPMRYTLGHQDFVIAKTVNTFLLPAWRRRLVYLRFEQDCLTEAEAESLLDGSFSLAPEAARLRGALGYRPQAPVLHFERGLFAPGMLPRLLVRLGTRFPALPLGHLSHILAALPRPAAGVMLRESGNPEQDDFFQDFWRQARKTAGLAPRRDVADLVWRFWGDTNIARTTLTCRWPSGASGYAILRHDDPRVFSLDDIALSESVPGLLQQFLDAIFGWCRARGALMVSFMTSADGQPPPLLAVIQRNMSVTQSRHGGCLTRRLTLRGQARLGPEWPATNFTIMATPA